MKKRFLAVLIAFALLISCLGTVSFADDTYPQEEVEQTLAALMEKYCGTYWTDNFRGARQCKGFADMIFHALFGTYGPGPYSDARYSLPDAESRCCTCLGILSPSQCTPDALKALLSQALPGDYVQCVRYTGTQHSMIVVETTDSGITLFDCNLKSSNFCGSYTYCWDEVGEYLTRGISLYRHNGYVPSETYRLYFDANGGECISLSKEVAVGNPYGALPTPERTGYHFDYWYIQEFNFSRTPATYPVTENSTKTAYSNTYLIAHWTAAESICAINGHVWGNTTQIASTCELDGYTQEVCSVCGTTRSFDYLPAIGHDLSLIGAVPVSNVEDGYETYECARCGKIETKTILCPLNRFADLNTDAWYYPYVRTMVAEELMNGLSETTFAPDVSLTRAMLVTILYRMNQSPEAAASGFADVDRGSWFADAVDWAAAVGVVTGYPDGTFHPNDAITREQAATILYRYAQLLGRNHSSRASLNGYGDMDAVHGYAIEPMEWACACGILSGFPDLTLRPTGTATRVQIAKMLVILLEDVQPEAGVG